MSEITSGPTVMCRYIGSRIVEIYYSKYGYACVRDAARKK